MGGRGHGARGALWLRALVVARRCTTVHMPRCIGALGKSACLEHAAHGAAAQRCGGAC